MAASNLPPGCRISDIPGNRPEDALRETQADAIYDALKPLRDVADSNYDEVEDKVNEQLCKMLNEAFEQGYQQATNDAEEAKLWQQQKTTELGSNEQEA